MPASPPDHPRRPAGDLPSPLQGGAVRRGWRLARLWFASDERGTAWALAGITLALKLAQVGVQVRFNLWHRDSFDALQRRTAPPSRTRACSSSASPRPRCCWRWRSSGAGRSSRCDWRRWLVRTAAAALAGRRAALPAGTSLPRRRRQPGPAHQREHALGDRHRGRPGGRAAAGGADAGQLPRHALDAVGAAARSPSGHRVRLPGYMVWAALLYAGDRRGADLGASAGRMVATQHPPQRRPRATTASPWCALRENSEAIALIRGEARRGARRCRAAFGRVVAVMRDLLRTRAAADVARPRPTAWSPACCRCSCASPRYFAGAITLGVLMQIGRAFVEVTRA